MGWNSKGEAGGVGERGFTLEREGRVIPDDEIVPRDACLELFDVLGAKRKTLHANPGMHAAVPAFEVASSADYLDRYVR